MNHIETLNALLQVSGSGGPISVGQVRGRGKQPQGCHQPAISDLASMSPQIIVQLKGFCAWVYFEIFLKIVKDLFLPQAPNVTSFFISIHSFQSYGSSYKTCGCAFLATDIRTPGSWARSRASAKACTGPSCPCCLVVSCRAGGGLGTAGCKDPRQCGFGLMQIHI